MTKKAIIEVSLVEECCERSNQEVANEIFKELSEDISIIPWCKQINKVVITENYE
jgi:hypothetical protein